MNPTWQTDDGRIQLYCGNCLTILPEIGKVDAVITDPPYGAGYASNPILGKNRASKPHKPQSWDKGTIELVSILAVAEIAVIWGGNYQRLPLSRGWLIWFKPDALPSMAQLEMAWTNQDMNSRLISHATAATNAERIGHCTQKPVRVMQWCMKESHVPENAIVLDPFMGSDTTGIACIRTGRRFVGIEISPEYFEIAKNRIKVELQQQLLSL